MEIKYIVGATPLEPEELSDLIPSHIQTQWQLNEWESINVESWLDWAQRGKKDIVTEMFCKTLHKKMFGKTWKWAGSFRRSDKNIGCPWIKIALELREVLDTTRFWIENKTFPIHEIAIRFHYRLVFVHSFPNGNGRFSRAMADILIARHKQTPLLWNTFWDIANMSDIHKKYIESLRKADNGDFSDLIDLCSPK